MLNVKFSSASTKWVANTVVNPIAHTLDHVCAETTVFANDLKNDGFKVVSVHPGMQSKISVDVQSFINIVV